MGEKLIGQRITTILYTFLLVLSHPIYIYIYIWAESVIIYAFVIKSIVELKEKVFVITDSLVCVYIYIYIYMCVCECVCVCIYIYIYNDDKNPSCINNVFFFWKIFKKFVKFALYYKFCFSFNLKKRIFFFLYFFLKFFILIENLNFCC